MTLKCVNDNKRLATEAQDIAIKALWCHLLFSWLIPGWLWSCISMVQTTIILRFATEVHLCHVAFLFHHSGSVSLSPMPNLLKLLRREYWLCSAQTEWGTSHNSVSLMWFRLVSCFCCVEAKFSVIIALCVSIPQMGPVACRHLITVCLSYLPVQGTQQTHFKLSTTTLFQKDHQILNHYA